VLGKFSQISPISQKIKWKFERLAQGNGNNKKLLTWLKQLITHPLTIFVMKSLNELSYEVRGAIYNVHKYLGPGLFESVYEAALMYELNEMGFKTESQIDVPVRYKNIHLNIGFRLDILVENDIIIEVKSIESLLDVHKKQLLTYLKLTDKKLGFLVNFNSSSIIDRESLLELLINNYSLSLHSSVESVESVRNIFPYDYNNYSEDAHRYKTELQGLDTGSRFADAIE
jgi:GxxExxY protein